MTQETVEDRPIDKVRAAVAAGWSDEQEIADYTGLELKYVKQSMTRLRNQDGKEQAPPKPRKQKVAGSDKVLDPQYVGVFDGIGRIKIEDSGGQLLISVWLTTTRKTLLYAFRDRFGGKVDSSNSERGTVYTLKLSYQDPQTSELIRLIAEHSLTEFKSEATSVLAFLESIENQRRAAAALLAKVRERAINAGHDLPDNGR